MIGYPLNVADCFVGCPIAFQCAAQFLPAYSPRFLGLERASRGERRSKKGWRPSADYPVRSVADVNLLTRPLAAFFDAISRIPWPEDGPEPPVRVLGLGMALWNHENPRA